MQTSQEERLGRCTRFAKQDQEAEDGRRKDTQAR